MAETLVACELGLCRDCCPLGRGSRLEKAKLPSADHAFSATLVTRRQLASVAASCQDCIRLVSHSHPQPHSFVLYCPQCGVYDNLSSTSSSQHLIHHLAKMAILIPNLGTLAVQIPVIWATAGVVLLLLIISASVFVSFPAPNSQFSC